MKRNNVAKRLGIASLCLATALSAVSGITLSKTNVANADGAQTTDYVYTTANVTQDTTGLTISSNEAYSAMFKGVFTGDTTLKFRFPETYDSTLGFYGNFNIRIADATNDTNYFDIEYYVENASKFCTTPCVKWQDQARTTSHHTSGAGWYNSQITGKQNHCFAPCFLSKTANADRGTRMGILQLKWIDLDTTDTDTAKDVLTVSANSAGVSSATDMVRISAFDGTYDTTASKQGFVEKSKWGLPKISFTNGYTITVSSDFTKTGVEDHATDVLLSSLETNGTSYDLTTGTEFTSHKQAFTDTFACLTQADVPTLAAGKVFLGWRNTDTDSLYPAEAIMLQGKYEAYVIDYDTVTGAAVRIAGKSGIRFQTMFDATQYATLKEKGILESFGTIIAYTDTLTSVGKDFTIENYQDQATFAQVQNTKGVFDYTVGSKAYKAYTMGVVDIADYTKEYSARGYLMINYVDGFTRVVYTDFNATDNSRSIADVANRIKTTALEEYNALSDAKKAIIDAYAAAYVAPQN